MYLNIKRVKCAGCGTVQVYREPGLRIKYNPTDNYQMLFACSANCAQKFRTKKPDEPDVLITKKGPIPYRKVTQTTEN